MSGKSAKAQRKQAATAYGELVATHAQQIADAIAEYQRQAGALADKINALETFVSDPVALEAQPAAQDALLSQIAAINADFVAPIYDTQGQVESLLAAFRQTFPAALEDYRNLSDAWRERRAPALAMLDTWRATLTTVKKTARRQEALHG